MNLKRYIKYYHIKKKHKKYVKNYFNNFYQEKIKKIITGKLISHEIVDNTLESSSKNENILSDKTVFITFQYENKNFDFEINQKYIVSPIGGTISTYYEYQLKLNNVIIHMKNLSDLYIQFYNWEKLIKEQELFNVLKKI